LTRGGKKAVGLLVTALVMQTASPCQKAGVVRVKIIGTRLEYCEVDPDLAAGKVHVSLKLLNTTSRNVIVSSQLGPTELIRVTSLSGRDVYRPDYHFLETSNVQLGSAPDNKMFEIVGPHTSVERDLVVSVPIAQNSVRSIPSSVLPGDYYLTVRRSIWPFYADEGRANKMRSVWKRYGLLDLTPVTVRALPIHLSPPRQMEQCSSADSSDTGPPKTDDQGR
jgi:hypothetical protein